MIDLYTWNTANGRVASIALPSLWKSSVATMKCIR